MYGHVIRQWFNEATTDGVRPAISSIYHDVCRGLYFLYFRSRLDSHSTTDTTEITKLYVDPDDIRWVSTAPRSMLPRYGENGVVGTVSGSWDKFRTPVKKTKTFQSLKTAYHDDTPHDLIQSIRDGYREADIDSGEKRRIRGVEIPDEIRLAVGRNGQLMRWSGGLHRLSAAQLLGVDRIPAYVVVWHTDSDKEQIITKYGDESSRDQQS